MKIDISKDTAITLAAWVTVIGFFFLLFGQIGEMRSDIDNMEKDIHELQEDMREIRQILVSHLEFHARGEKISVAGDEKGE